MHISHVVWTCLDWWWCSRYCLSFRVSIKRGGGGGESTNNTDMMTKPLLCYVCSLWGAIHLYQIFKLLYSVASPIFLVIFSATVYQEVTILFSLTRWMETVLYSHVLCDIPVLRISQIRIFGWKHSYCRFKIWPSVSQATGCRHPQAMASLGIRNVYGLDIDRTHILLFLLYNFSSLK